MRAVLIHKADGPDAITIGERHVREPGSDNQRNEKSG